MDVVEREAIKLTAIMLAAEKWAKQFAQAPDQHAIMLQNSARLQIGLTRLLKSMAAKAGDFINTAHYDYQLSQTKTQTLDRLALDFNVDVIVNNDQIDDFSGMVIKVAYAPVKNIIFSGVKAAEEIYSRSIGLHSTDAIIQDLTTQHVANLVGKRVNPDGSIVNNPKAKYNITETVRNNIASSVKTSLALGETSQEATKRMADIIDDPARAEMIANTESVRAFNSGIYQYGLETDSVGKQWYDAGASDECADNSDEGPVGIDESFSSGDDYPPAHPNCRCSIRMIDKTEWDDNGYGDDSDN